MSHQFCDKCNERVMVTMRMCPNCGNKTFSASPHSATSQTISQSTGPTVGISSGPASIIQPISSRSNSVGITFEPAGNFKRFIAAMIDGLIVGILSAVPISLSYGSVAASSPTSGPNLLLIMMTLVSIVIPYAYYTILHSSSERATWGKRVMGLMVVTVQGERLTKLQAFIRIILTALLPIAGLLVLGLSTAGMLQQYKNELQDSIFIAAGLGALFIYVAPFAMIFFNTSRQTLFDMICKTCVIKRTTP